MVKHNATVIVIDPDPVVRASMEALIRQSGWAPFCIGSASELLAANLLPGPTCIVLRVDLPELDGVALIRQMVEERKEMPVIAVSARHDLTRAIEAMKAGAVEFLLMPVADETLVIAVAGALSQSTAVLDADADLSLLRSHYALLSARERQVMAQVVAGLLNKQVGAVLGITEMTVKVHRGRVMRKMGADSLADLVSKSLRLDLPRAPAFDHRRERNVARTSFTNTAGCSQAAKWPPLAGRL